MSYGPSDSAINAFAITKSDSTVFPQFPSSTGVCVTKAVYVGTAGDLNVVMEGNQTVLHSNVPSGAILPIRVKQVLSTNTSASNIVGWW